MTPVTKIILILKKVCLVGEHSENTSLVNKFNILFANESGTDVNNAKQCGDQPFVDYLYYAIDGETNKSAAHRWLGKRQYVKLKPRKLASDLQSTS